METTVVLEAKGVSKTFLGFKAVDDVSLSVHQGTVHALIGPNGAGKTTMFNLMTRFIDPTAGDILLFGERITRVKPSTIARRGLVRSFQISAVYPHLSVLENGRLAIQRRHGSSMDFWRSQKALARLDAEAGEMLDSVGLADLTHQLAGSLPYGRRRILEIAATLALKPRVILLDEPMAGVGVEDIERISRLVRALVPAHTVLMVEHNLSVVSTISDHVTVLARGSVLAHGTYAEVAADPRVIEAYIGSPEEAA